MNLLILDIDGTMTLSEQHHLGAFEDAMRGVGVMNIDDDWKKYDHITDTHIFKHNYKAQFGEEPDDSIVELLEELMMDFIQEFVPPQEIPGAKQIVELVQRSSDYVFAYATGSLYGPAKFKLDETGIPYHEDILISSNGLDSREEIVMAAIEAAKRHYKIEKFEKIISAGDGLWDVSTARNLNLPFLGIGNKNQEKFKEEGVNFFIEDWEGVDIAYLNGITI